MNSWPYWSDAQSSAKSNPPQEPNSRPPSSCWWYSAPAAHYPPPAGYAGRPVAGHSHYDARYQPYQRPYYDPQASVAGVQQHRSWYPPAASGRLPPFPAVPHFTQQEQQQQQPPPFQPLYEEWPGPYASPPPVPRYGQTFSQPHQLSTVDGVQSGVPTLTTPTLTPTTLRNIQQTFLQASVNVHTQPPETHSNQAGFVPPVVHPQPGSTFISIDSKSLGGGIATLVDTSSATTDPGIKEATCGGGPPPLLPISGIISSSACPMPSVAALNVSSSSSNSSSSDSGNEHTTTTTTTASNRRMGGRRPNNTAKLSEEEEQKRLIRRERNKMAAARCRKRRLDQTMTLQEETDRLEEKKSSLQHEITVLQQQREELEFLLATHKAVCTRASRLGTASNVPSLTTAATVAAGRPVAVVTTACSDPLTDPTAVLDPASNICVKEEALSDNEELYTNSLFSSIIPRNKALEPVTAVSAIKTFTSTAAASKPHRPTSLAVAPLTELGVSIETPSAGLRGFNFDSMIDGGTGLTPVTPLTVGSMATGLTPLTTPIMPHPSASVASTTPSSKSTTHCSHQQRSNSSELSSPDSLTPKHLVSL